VDWTETDGVGTEIKLTGLSLTLRAASTFAGSSDTLVNPVYGQRVSQAADRVSDIISGHAGEDDNTKLYSYKSEICSSVQYDQGFIDKQSYSYIRQLVYVFDGDGSTNVGCEGYSRAFKYLCDLSTFRSSNVRVVTVTGQMRGATGAGEHMWNIVTMPDGKNYLADVTNCDEGTVGYPDQLFLKTASSHEKTDEYKYLNNQVTYIYDGFMASVIGTETLELVEEGEAITISFEQSEESAQGEQYTATTTVGSVYTLPECTVSAPIGKMFGGWVIDGKTYTAGDEIEVSENLSVEVVWVNEVKEAEHHNLEEPLERMDIVTD